MKCLALAVAATVLAAGCTASGSRALLRQLDHAVQSTHALHYRFDMPDGYRRSVIDTRRDTFNGHPFDISRMVFFNGTSAVMVHAEAVADASGASNYDDLPLTTISGLPFRERPASCEDLAPADIAGEHDLEWLARQGFSPTGPLRIHQYLDATPDHNAEVVITLMARVDDCASGDATDALARVRADLSLRHW